ESVVDLALAVHPLAALRLAHQLGEAVLQHAGADAREHVVAAVFLEHDVVDALEVQELGQQQPRRPAADDADLNLHCDLLPNIANSSQNRPRRPMEGSAFILYNSNMAIARSKSSIQVYNLFGESGDLPDVVHCETIATRSVRHDWSFAAHRHARLHQ